MPLLSSDTADKIIVDRRKPHRNSDVARAVRKTRDRLNQQPGSVNFDRELLKLHARAVTGSIVAVALIVLAVAAAGLMFGMGRSISVWALIAISCYVGLAVVARIAVRTAPSEIDVRKTTRAFLGAHVVSGLGWAYLAMLDCGACQLDQFSVIKATILLVAIAATALVASSLRGALAATFVVPVATYAFFGVGSWTPVNGLMVGLLVAAVPFFTYVAGLMNRSALITLAFRTEKDALIAELDTAKSMSDEARRRAEEANLAKSRFLATMSHELRTPLNAILGFSEVMAKEVLGPLENPTYRDYAGDIHSSGRHLLDLINEILDLSRIEAGRYQLNEEPVDLVSVVEECCHLVELKASNKNIRIVQLFENALPQLFADKRAIRQIVLNLLSNAVKFTSSKSEIVVRAGWTAGGGQYVSVKDNGPGMAAEEIPIVLAAFGQGSISIKSAEQGTGLGLPIVQGLVAIHQGQFELHSKLREGTEAIAIFPAARVMEKLPALPTMPSKTAQRSR